MAAVASTTRSTFSDKFVSPSRRSRSAISLESGRRSVKTPKNGGEQISEREGWWRSHLKETPNPGAYEIKDFVQEIDSAPVRQSYRFRDSGRKKNADNSRKGSTLMPGLYKHHTFLDDIGKRQVTYSFKSCDRYHVPTALVGYMDREFTGSQISPCTYDRGYQYVEKLPSKHSGFKSQVQRFPTVHFTPKKGPSPGQYDSSKRGSWAHPLTVSSSFKSNTARFAQPHVLKTPGPGSYDKTYQTPMPETIKRMGRSYGLFFTCGADGEYW